MASPFPSTLTASAAPNAPAVAPPPLNFNGLGGFAAGAAKTIHGSLAPSVSDQLAADTLAAANTDTANKIAEANNAAARSNIGTANNIVDSVIGTEGSSLEQIAAAKASGINSQGDLAEAGAYTTAAGIAGENATLAKVSGDIAGFQQMRGAMRTIGAQKAGIAAAGFADSGTALNLGRSSLQQAYLAHQVIGVNSTLEQNGFLEAQTASNAEATAATTASTAALTLQAEQQAAGELSAANAQATSTSLASVLPGSPQASLAASAASGVPMSATDLAANEKAQFTQATVNPSVPAAPTAPTIPTGNPNAPLITQPNAQVQPAAPTSQFPTTQMPITTPQAPTPGMLGV